MAVASDDQYVVLWIFLFVLIIDFHLLLSIGLTTMTLLNTFAFPRTRGNLFLIAAKEKGTPSKLESMVLLFPLSERMVPPLWL